MNLFRSVTALVVACCSIAGIAQQTKKSPAFVLDATRPYVYFELDHVGPTFDESGKLAGPEGVWGRLHNNCSLPISVDGNGAIPGNGDGDLWYEVIKYDPSTWSGAGVFIMGGELPPVPDFSSMPSGGHFDVGSTFDIQPGKYMTFIIPATAIQKYWHVEIQFRFQRSPRGVTKGIHIPNKRAAIIGTPYQSLSINWYDMPEAYRATHPPKMKSVGGPLGPMKDMNPPKFE